jgi:hypothetical protein
MNTSEELLGALKTAAKLLEKFERAVCGNDQLAGCEEFYRGYNAVTRRIARESAETLALIRPAIAKAEGRD